MVRDLKQQAEISDQQNQPDGYQHNFRHLEIFRLHRINGFLNEELTDPDVISVTSTYR
jgi:hypothetical protein